MRRSLLFIPGNNPGMIQNASLFDADGVIFDFEDAVSVSEKDSARELVKSFLEANKLDDIEVVVRINDYNSLFFKDDLEIISNNVDTLMIPKARFDDLVEISMQLSLLEKELDIDFNIKLIPIIELAISLLEIEKIVTLPRVDGVLLGAEDLTNDMEIARTAGGEELLYPRNKIAYACKAFKVDAIDTPFPDVNNDEELYQDCENAKMVGMNSKACIHPRQVKTVNKIFSPSAEEIKQSKKIVNEAKKYNVGAFSIDGKMIDKPIIERSKKLLAKARKFGMIK